MPVRVWMGPLLLQSIWFQLRITPAEHVALQVSEVSQFDLITKAPVQSLWILDQDLRRAGSPWEPRQLKKKQWNSKMVVVETCEGKKPSTSLVLRKFIHDDSAIGEILMAYDIFRESYNCARAVKFCGLVDRLIFYIAKSMIVSEIYLPRLCLAGHCGILCTQRCTRRSTCSETSLPTTRTIQGTHRRI